MLEALCVGTLAKSGMYATVCSAAHDLALMTLSQRFYCS
jgi:hypothetical protein